MLPASKAKSVTLVLADSGRKPTQSDSHLVWLDLEMTGLDVAEDVILQAAVVITNSDLVELAAKSWTIWQPEEKLAKMTPFVRKMHEETGLLSKVRQSTTELGQAEGEALEIISAWCPYRAILCGNSVWQDRVFIDRYWPGLARYLHYRLVDVSTLKVLARLWYGEAAVYVKPDKGKHEAEVDIRNSIAELAHYRHSIFKAPFT